MLPVQPSQTLLYLALCILDMLVHTKEQHLNDILKLCTCHLLWIVLTNVVNLSLYDFCLISFRNEIDKKEEILCWDLTHSHTHGRFVQSLKKIRHFLNSPTWIFLKKILFLVCQEQTHFGICCLAIFFKNSIKINQTLWWGGGVHSYAFFATCDQRHKLFSNSKQKVGKFPRLLRGCFINFSNTLYLSQCNFISLPTIFLQLLLLHYGLFVLFSKLW